MTRKLLFCLSALLVLLQPLTAAPLLRLNVPEALKLQDGTVRPIWVTAGTNGPGDLFFEAWNAGDGSLNLTVSGGESAWLTPVITGTQPCSFDGSRTCTRVRVLFDAAALPNGTQQGVITVSDPNAVDSPQQVPIKIYVGGNVPERIDLYVRPVVGDSDSVEFQTGDHRQPVAQPALRPNPAGQYLSVSSSGLGSFRFLHTHRITGTFRSGLAVGDRDGTVTVTGSTFPADNRTIPVTLHITNSPIVRTPAQLSFATAQGMAAPTRDIVLSNRGGGSVTVSEVEVETGSGGEWLAAEDLGNNTYRVTAEVGELEPGFYNGTLRFTSNAANGPTEVPVAFEVQPQRGPQALFRGLVNNADFDSTRPVAPGTIVALFGSQFASSAELANEVPLPTTLASTKVMIDGIEAPLFFASYGQINLQIPYEVAAGTRIVQVIRDGEPGNRISATIDSRSPGLILSGVGLYGAILNASQGRNRPLPRDLGASLGLRAAPARPGDILEVFATGLGSVDPSVRTGAAAPGSPLSRAVQVPLVNYGRSSFFGPFERPRFIGLAPGFVGLFQINVAVPEGAPTNPRTPLTLEYSDGRRSNTVEIAVER